MIDPFIGLVVPGRAQAELVESIASRMTDMNPVIPVKAEIVSWDPCDDETKLPEAGNVYVCVSSKNPLRLRHFQDWLVRERETFDRRHAEAKALIMSASAPEAPVTAPSTPEVITFGDGSLEEILLGDLLGTSPKAA